MGYSLKYLYKYYLYLSLYFLPFSTLNLFHEELGILLSLLLHSYALVLCKSLVMFIHQKVTVHLAKYCNLSVFPWRKSKSLFLRRTVQILTAGVLPLRKVQGMRKWLVATWHVKCSF